MSTPIKNVEGWQKEDAERLKNLYKQRTKLSQAEFGEKFEIGTQGMVWQYLNAKRPLNLRALLRFCKGLDIKDPSLISPKLAEELDGRNPGDPDIFFVDSAERIINNNPITIDDSSDFVGVKRVNIKISAGISGYAIEYLDDEKPPIFFRKDWFVSKGFDPSALHALRVSGESMQPSLYDGDIVVANIDLTQPKDGETFAVNFEGELIIKRMIRNAGEWWLRSDNEDKRRFPDKLCDENCFVIGKIVYKQSEHI